MVFAGALPPEGGTPNPEAHRMESRLLLNSRRDSRKFRGPINFLSFPPREATIHAMLKLLRRVSLTQWILIAMVAGVLIGWAFPAANYPSVSQGFKLFSTIFLKMIKCILVPLVFGTLVVG